jgi:hypothetical protein
VPKESGMRDLLFGGYATLLARSRASTICGMAQSKLDTSINGLFARAERS